MTGPLADLLCWNVRGLNRQDRRDAVHQTISATRCHLACFQETKLREVTQVTANYLGGYRLNKFAFKPGGGILGTRGGILLWNEDFLECSNVTTGEFHLAADVTVKQCATQSRLMVVY
ncbi:hypothetical protein BS78_03G156100 [Paspalum vaginatum]|nr:hypothetical protein BS78_03G156100 [Paspalum vaginatum]